MSDAENLVWVTGAGGLLGNYIVQLAPQSVPGWRLRPIIRADLDLLDCAAVEREFKKDQPRMIVHCAAITNVSEAQKNPELARRVNCDVTHSLASLAADIPFVFFSTDLVFDGHKGNYSEADAVNPLTFYGETKVIAENVVLQNPRHLVVRTSINAGVSPSRNRAFNEQLRATLQASGQGMTLFTDEFRCPIPAIETARAIWDLMRQNRAGLYHVAGAEKLSRWEIAKLLVARWPEVKTTIQSGSAKNFAGPPRALDTSLNISKAQNVLSVPLPGFSRWLTDHPNAEV